VLALKIAHALQIDQGLVAVNTEHSKFGLKFGKMCAYNFGARGSNLTKLFHMTCCKANMII